MALYLVNDGGTALLPELVLGSGNTLTLTLNMSFKPVLAGNRAFYLAACDAVEHNFGWQTMGAWTVQ